MFYPLVKKSPLSIIHPGAILVLDGVQNNRGGRGSWCGASGIHIKELSRRGQMQHPAFTAECMSTADTISITAIITLGRP